MKVLFITVLLAAGLLSVIIYLDFLMDLTGNDFFWKALNPFRVMEPAEYIIIGFFLLLSIRNSVWKFIKKKKQNSPS